MWLLVHYEARKPCCFRLISFNFVSGTWTLAGRNLMLMQVWMQIQEELLFSENQRLGQTYDTLGDLLLQIGAR